MPTSTPAARTEPILPPLPPPLAGILARDVPILVRFRGAVPYTAAVALQEALVAHLRGRRQPVLLLLEHPPVVTLGRGAPASSAAGARWPVVRCARGGDVTAHGPGQWVGYPLLDLRRHALGVHDYIRRLEGVLEATARRFGAPAHTVVGRTGLWTPRGKLASIGIAVRRGVTWHGFALYVHDQRELFAGITPCALPHVQPDALVHHAPDVTLPDVATELEYHFARAFALERPWERVELPVPGEPTP